MTTTATHIDHYIDGRRYPSDMSDAEWAAVRPLLPCRPGFGGGADRPRVTVTGSCWT
ncbi:transposase [Streptomyces sp. NPDC004270]